MNENKGTMTLKLAVILHKSGAKSSDTEIKSDNKEVRQLLKQMKAQAGEREILFFKILKEFNKELFRSVAEPMVYNYLENKPTCSEDEKAAMDRLLRACGESEWPRIESALARWRKIASDLP